MDSILINSCNKVDQSTLLHNKIKQTVEYGSVALALETKYFTIKNLLHWLVLEPFSDKTEIAYFILCNNLHPNHHFLDNGDHFIYVNIEYIKVARIFNLDIGLMININGGIMTPSILNSISKEKLKIDEDSPKMKYLSLLKICRSNDRDYTRQNLTNLYRVRKFDFINYLTDDEINKSLVESDWIERFRYNDNLIGYIIEHVKLLKDKAINYYNDCIQQEYFKVVKKLYDSKLLYKLSREELILFNDLFPNIINIDVLGYNNLGFKLSQMSNELSGYLLGFPIHQMVPDDKQIQLQIKSLIELGIDKYVENVKEYTKKTNSVSLSFSTETNIVNTTDVLTEDIDNYLPFDIVTYQVGNNIYRFTRPEFENLLETKKNPWTNEFFSSFLILNIKLRISISKLYNLPESKTYKELLKELDNENFLLSSKTEEKQSRQLYSRINHELPDDLIFSSVIVTYHNDDIPTTTYYRGGSIHRN